MKLLRSLILVAIASVLTFPQTPAPKWEFDEYGRWIYGKGGSVKEPSYTEEQARLFRQRWAVLNTTIKQTENEWEGDYHLPSMQLGELRFRWTQESGFVLVDADTCRLTVTHLSYGQAYADGSQVVLLPEFPVKPADSWDEALLGRGPAKYVPVRWDGAHYLVRENDLKNFFDLNAGRAVYNNHEERSYAIFFVKDGDSEDHDSLNDVIVPRDYEKLIRKPINASITKVGKTLNYHRHTVPDPSTVEPPVPVTTPSITKHRWQISATSLIGRWVNRYRRLPSI